MAITLQGFSLWQILLPAIGAYVGYLGIQKSISIRNEKKRSYGKVKGPKGHWFWGNLDVLGPTDKAIRAAAKSVVDYPKLELLHLGPAVTFISCHWPCFVEKIITTDHPKEYWAGKFLYPWLGEGLILSQGEKWKKHRKLLTPAFHTDMLKNYVTIFNECTDKLITKLSGNDKPVEMYGPVNMMVVDSMLRCFMSYETDCQNNDSFHPFVKAVNDITEVFLIRYAQLPWSASDFLFGLTEPGKRFAAAVAVTDGKTTEVINHRREQLQKTETGHAEIKGSKVDLIDLLLSYRDKEDNGLSEEEIRHEINTFLFTGHGTTGCGLSWVIYDLAVNSDHQERCREEVDDVMNDIDFASWEDVSKMNYMTLCIKESMRIHPPFPALLPRSIKKPVILDNNSDSTSSDSQEFPAGTVFSLNAYALHNNPQIWQEPDRFDPNRFTIENSSKRSRYSYIPFSAGPRNCLGQQFALTEIKVTVAKLLKKFKFVVDDTCPKTLMEPKVLLRTESGFFVRFVEL